MPDLITRLKVDSTEYDAKIKRAAQGVQHFVKSCHDNDEVIGRLLGNTRKYVESIGQMETVSTTAKGRLNELTAAFTDLRSVYNSLSEEEKNAKGGFGQELNKQLEILKKRINDTKQELKGIDQELGNTKQAEDSAKGGIEGLTSALGINVKSLVGWGAALTAGKAALDVAKDAFFATEGNIDEWGRTVKEAEGAYDVFLQTINNGNWSNFFQNLNTAMKGARELYDALDRLGSVKSNNQAAIAIQQQRIQQLRLLKDQGKNVDEELKAATERLAQLQNQAVQAGKTAGAKSIKETIKNGYNTQGGGQIGDKTLDRVTNELLQNGQVAFDKYNMRAKALEKKGQDTRLRTYTGSGGVSYTFEESYFNINKLTEEEQKQYKLAKAITERETTLAEGIGIYAQAVQEGAASAREQFKGNKYVKAGTGGEGGSGTNPQEQAAKAVKDAELAYSQAIDKARMEVESGLKTDADMKKAMLAGQERLYDAYGKAYNTYADPKYKEAQDAAAEEIVKLGGEVKTAIEAQKAAEQAAREQEAAAKKLADAQTKLADAQQTLADANASGDLKAIYAAQKGVETAQAGVVKAGGSVEAPSGGVALPVTVNYTTSNMEAFTAKLKEDLSKAEVGSELFNKLTEQMSDSSAISTILGTAIQNGIKQMPFDASAVMQKLLNGEDISDTAIQGYVEALNEKLKVAFDETEWPNVLITIDADTKQIVNAAKQQEKEAKAMTHSWQDAGTAIQAVGNAMQQIEDPAAKVLGTIAQAIATMALSYAQAAASPAVTGTGWGWIAFAATGLATMLSSIAAIKNATSGFANGGIIPGNSFSGDNLRGITPDGNVYGLNAGELVLSKSQQSNLANALEDRDGVSESQPYVLGEQIWFGLKAYTQRRGMGEIITSR